MKWLKLAFKNVLRNKRRAVITMLITTLGVASILVGGGFANYTYVGLREMAARDSGHLIIAHQDYFTKDEETSMQYGLSNYQALAEGLRADEHIRYILPRIEFSGLISNGDKSSIFIGAGVDPAGEFKVKGPFLTLVEGSVLSRRESADDPRIVIGRNMARSMGVKSGDSLTLMSTTVDGGLNALDVTVQGVMTTGVPEMDKRSIFVNLRTAQELMQTDKISTLSLFLRETAATSSMVTKLAESYPQYALQTWLDKAFYYLGVKGIYDRIFGLLGIIILVMVFFSLSNTIGMSVMERTREIGSLRAMGSYRWEINRSFTLEGLVIGTIGSVLGMVLAVAVSVSFSLLDLQMPPPPGRSEGYPLAVDIPTELFLVTILSSIAVCMLAAWLASRKASSKAIVEALSHV